MRRPDPLTTALLHHASTAEQAYFAAKQAGNVELAEMLRAHGLLVASAIRKQATAEGAVPQ